MIPRSPATIGLRIIALVILMPAMFRLGTLVFLMLQGHTVTQPTNPIIAPSFDRSPGAKVVRTIPSSTIAWLVTRVAGGVALFIFSKPLVDLVVRRAE
jgi:hypothetical protein